MPAAPAPATATDGATVMPEPISELAEASADVMAELTAPVPLPMPSAYPSMSALPE